MKEIKAFVQLQNGQLLSSKNHKRIVARSTTVCTNVIHREIDNKTYHEEWRISRECKGYIFREVKHGGGICGHHPSVRALVLATLCGLAGAHIRVMVEEDSDLKGGAL